MRGGEEAGGKRREERKKEGTDDQGIFDFSKQIPRFLRSKSKRVKLDCNSDPFGTVWESRSMITFPPLFI